MKTEVNILEYLGQSCKLKRGSRKKKKQSTWCAYKERLNSHVGQFNFMMLAKTGFKKKKSGFFP